MPEVYVVTSGCYSDYGINGIFSKRELAEDYIKLLTEGERHWSDTPTIEVWALDDYRRGRTVTRVRMDREGTVIDIITEPYLYHYLHAAGFDFFLRQKENDFSDSLLGWNVVDCPNDTTAIKIVNEKRTIILAHDYWGQSDKVRELFNGDKQDE